MKRNSFSISDILFGKKAVLLFLMFVIILDIYVHINFRKSDIKSENPIISSDQTSNSSKTYHYSTEALSSLSDVPVLKLPLSLNRTNNSIIKKDIVLVSLPKNDSILQSKPKSIVNTTSRSIKPKNENNRISLKTMKNDNAALLENFDWKYYVAKNPDLSKKGINTEFKAIQHYLLRGQYENRSGVKRDVRTAALFTPYNLTPGGGEKYLLTAARTFVDMNYKVTIIIYNRNVCHTKECIQETVDKLNVDLDMNQVTILLIDHIHYFYKNKMSSYDLFFLLGNEKIPQLPGIGRLNIFMCQFPFDINRLEEDHGIRRLSTYDIVLLNSYFTLHHYEEYILPYFVKAEALGLVHPSVKVLYPPTGFSSEISFNTSLKVNHTRTSFNIAMLGRFFTGRQNKGHRTAIATFKKFLTLVNRPVKLLLIGNQQPRFEGFVEELREAAIGYPIELHVSVDEDKVAELLQSASVFWHMTGIEEPSGLEDPASLEHFGISVVEAMSFGCIPIVLNRGGTVEIVRHNHTGFIAANKDDYIRYTLGILNMQESERLTLSSKISEASKVFSTQSFKTKFMKIIARSRASFLFRRTVQRIYHQKTQCKNLPDVVAIGSANLTAVIVEESINSHFKFCVCNMIRYLEGKASFIVYHSKQNAVYVKKILSNIEGIEFIETTNRMSSITDYNNLLKSTSFWDSMKANKTLVFQSDSVLLRNGIEEFMQYDYVGKLMY